MPRRSKDEIAAARSSAIAADLYADPDRAILAIDGATHPGFALTRGTDWATFTTFTAELERAVRELRPHVVVEAQYAGGETSKRNLVTLCARAWYLYGAAAACAGRVAWSATAAGWRGSIAPSLAGIEKKQALNLIWAEHGSHLPAPAGLSLDELDAAAIAFSFRRALTARTVQSQFHLWPDLPKEAARGQRRRNIRRR